MADFWTDAYNFLQAPANARKANEAFKVQTAGTAPSFSQVQSFMRPEERLAPSNPYPLALNVGAATGPVGGKMGNEMFGPPMAPAGTGMVAGNGTPMQPPIPASVDDRLNARARAAELAWLQAQQRPAYPPVQPYSFPQANVPLPRPRPGYAPTAMDIAAMNRPVGANPGMGGAMFGDGRMSPQIPPQQPPADGSGTALPVWAGDNPPQRGPRVRGGTVQRANGTNGYVYGRSAGGPWHQQGTNRAPGIGPAQQYASANLMGQVNALNRQAQATGQAGGYQYQNGQRVGYASQNIGGQTVTPRNGADAYGLANLAGQIAALNRQANATGVGTNGYTYQNGVNMGYSAQEQAAKDARGKAIGDANRKSANPSYTVSGDNNSFQPQSVQNSERWQTGY